MEADKDNMYVFGLTSGDLSGTGGESTATMSVRPPWGQWVNPEQAGTVLYRGEDRAFHKQSPLDLVKHGFGHLFTKFLDMNGLLTDWANQHGGPLRNDADYAIVWQNIGQGWQRVPDGHTPGVSERNQLRRP